MSTERPWNISLVTGQPQHTTHASPKKASKFQPAPAYLKERPYDGY